METTRFITLPGEAFQLEEVNLPMHLARELAAQSVMVEVLPEEPAFTRRVEVHGANDDFSGWIDREGICWNDYHPLRVFFTDESRKVWRLPRRWAEVRRAPNEQQIDSCYTVVREAVFSEGIHLPSVWDLLELNLPLSEAQLAAGRPTTVAVHVAPHEPVRLLWPDSVGTQWRIPNNWRRRRVQLPAYDLLVAQGVTDGVAERYAGKSVSVNYHPGSLCCLPDQYRFRDEYGNRYPVHVRDCVLLGYGDGPEHFA